MPGGAAWELWGVPWNLLGDLWGCLGALGGSLGNTRSSCVFLGGTRGLFESLSAVFLELRQEAYLTQLISEAQGSFLEPQWFPCGARGMPWELLGLFGKYVEALDSSLGALGAF